MWFKLLCPIDQAVCRLRLLMALPACISEAAWEWLQHLFCPSKLFCYLTWAELEVQGTRIIMRGAAACSIHAA